tara:strand:+ start:51 stop:647 length:597 start_codon:yes stop_codon:yes gene_type:complete
MGVVKLSTAGILDYSKTSNFLSGNAPLSLGSFDLLETTTLATSASSVTFSGLGAYSDYKHLQLRIVGQTNNYPGLSLRFNSDSGSNYALHRLLGNGSTVSSNNLTSWTEIRLVNSLPDEKMAGTGIFGAIVMDILDFGSSSKNTTIRALSGVQDTDYSSVQLHSGFWNNTNAVTNINIFDSSGGSYVTGSRFSLYGVK